jgi:DNA-binding NarL/FixJ family response regulator
MQQTPIRTIVAEPDPLARRVVAGYLRDSGRFEVVAESGDGEEALELIATHRPHVLVTEMSLSRINGLDLIGRVAAASPSTRVVALTAFEDSQLAISALRRGASGVLSKSIGGEAIVRAVEAVHTGEAAVTRELTSEIVRRFRAIPEPGQGLRPVRSDLTNREWEVLDLVAAGAGTREIAATLVLTEDTVYSHLKSVMRKLGVRNREAAVEAARRLLDPTSG